MKLEPLKTYKKDELIFSFSNMETYYDYRINQDKIISNLEPTDSFSIDNAINEINDKLNDPNYMLIMRDMYIFKYGIDNFRDIVGAISDLKKIEKTKTDPNIAEAFKWYEKAAKQNNNQAAYILSIFYSKGIFVEKNENKALEYGKIAYGLSKGKGLENLIINSFWNGQKDQAYAYFLLYQKKGIPLMI